MIASIFDLINSLSDEQMAYLEQQIVKCNRVINKGGDLKVALAMSIIEAASMQMSSTDYLTVINYAEKALPISVLPLTSRALRVSDYFRNDDDNIAFFISKINSGSVLNVGKFTLLEIKQSHQFFLDHMMTLVKNNPYSLSSVALFYKDLDKKQELFADMKPEVHEFLSNLDRKDTYIFSSNSSCRDDQTLFSRGSTTPDNKKRLERFDMYLYNYSSLSDLENKNVSSFQKFIKPLNK